MPQIKFNLLKLTEIPLTHFIRVRSCHIIPFCQTHFYSKIVKFYKRSYSALLKTIKRELFLNGRNSSLFQFKALGIVLSSHRP